MNAKAKGTRAEHRCMRILEAAGYSCCRAAASLGLFDVIAIGPKDVKLVQVKCNRNAPPHEREAIELFKAASQCSKEIWIFVDYARKPVVHTL